MIEVADLEGTNLLRTTIPISPKIIINESFTTLCVALPIPCRV